MRSCGPVRLPERFPAGVLRWSSPAAQTRGNGVAVPGRSALKTKGQLKSDMLAGSVQAPGSRGGNGCPGQGSRAGGDQRRRWCLHRGSGDREIKNRLTAAASGAASCPRWGIATQREPQAAAPGVGGSGSPGAFPSVPISATLLVPRWPRAAARVVPAVAAGRGCRVALRLVAAAGATLRGTPSARGSSAPSSPSACSCLPASGSRGPSSWAACAT